MLTQKMTRTRCTCDFCGKKNWSMGHMRTHERHCADFARKIKEADDAAH